MKKIFFISGIILVGALLMASVARAETDITLDQNAVHQGFFAKAGDRIDLNGVVNGDVWVAGSDINIAGPIDGNLYVAGDKIRITGPVTGSIHVVGSDITINSKISGSMYLAGSKIYIDDATQIGRSAGIAGSSLRIAGAYSDQIYLAGSNIVFSGQANRNLRMAGGQIKLTETAKVAGSVRYDSETEAVIANDKLIAGQVIHDPARPKSNGTEWRQRLWDAFLGYITNIATAALMLAFVGAQLTDRAQTFRRLPIQSVVRGLGFLFLMPFLIIVALVSVIGIPAGVLGLLAYIGAFLLAPIAISFVLGVQLTKTPVKQVEKMGYGQKLQMIALGLLVVSILSLIPIFGGLMSFFLYLAGIGVLVADIRAPARPAKMAPKAS